MQEVLGLYTTLLGNVVPNRPCLRAPSTDGAGMRKVRWQPKKNMYCPASVMHASGSSCNILACVTGYRWVEKSCTHLCSGSAGGYSSVLT